MINFPCSVKHAYETNIPQGMVDNSLGPYRLAGPKALGPNYCNQPSDGTTFVWKS